MIFLLIFTWININVYIFNFLKSFYSKIWEIVMKFCCRFLMAQIRTAIELLTTILFENGTSLLIAEIFRLAKFNKDEAVCSIEFSMLIHFNILSIFKNTNLYIKFINIFVNSTYICQFVNTGTYIRIIVTFSMLARMVWLFQKGTGSTIDGLNY